MKKKFVKTNEFLGMTNVDQFFTILKLIGF